MVYSKSGVRYKRNCRRPSPSAKLTEFIILTQTRDLTLSTHDCNMALLLMAQAIGDTVRRTMNVQTGKRYIRAFRDVVWVNVHRSSTRQLEFLVDLDDGRELHVTARSDDELQEQIQKMLRRRMQ